MHHVIPGQFEIGTLQDEMTGVSLAGTQLRVNQYNMHDNEWNDIKVISGAEFNLSMYVKHDLNQYLLHLCIDNNRQRSHGIAR